MKRVRNILFSFMVIILLFIGVGCSKENSELDNSDANVKVDYDESASSAIEDIVDMLPEEAGLNTEKILELCKQAKIPQDKLLSVSTYIAQNASKVAATVLSYAQNPMDEEIAGKVYDLYVEISQLVGSTTIGRVIYVSICAGLEQIAEINSEKAKVATYYLNHLKTVDIEYFASVSRIMIGWINQELDREAFIILSRYFVTQNLDDLIALDNSLNEVEITSDQIKLLLEFSKKLTIDAMSEELFKLVYPNATTSEIDNFNKNVMFGNLVYEVLYNEVETMMTIMNASEAIEAKLAAAKNTKDYCKVVIYVYDEVLSSSQAKNLCKDIDNLLKGMNTMLDGKVPVLPITPTSSINSALDAMKLFKETVNGNSFTETAILEILLNYIGTIAPNVISVIPMA